MAESQMCAITVTRGGQALAARLGEEGIALRGGPQHFTALLPRGHTPLDLLRAAVESQATIVQLEPLFRPAAQ
jgi:hypothetical protein